MRLTLKISVLLCGVLLTVICGVLGLTYRFEMRNLEKNQDRRIQLALASLAPRCSAALRGGADEACLDGLGLMVNVTSPSSFHHALIVDRKWRVLVHSDFLRGDERRRGRAATEPHVRVALAADGPWIQRAAGGEEGLRVYSIPVTLREDWQGALMVAYREEGLAKELAWIIDDMRQRMFQAALVGLGAGVLLAVGLVLYFLAPLRALVVASRKVAAGDFRIRIPERRRDELGALAAEFNLMTRRLAELDELKDGFIARMTHDLRTPLAAMNGYVDLLLGGYQGPLPPEQEKSLRMVLRCGHDLSNLINDILDVTRIEAGRMGFSPRPVDLALAVRYVLDLLQVCAREYGVELASVLAAGLDQVYVDPEALRRVLTNLVSNALKFTGEGGRVWVEARHGEPNEVMFVVSDTGIGIPRDRQATLFTKFSQVPETRDQVRPSGGSGLGLLICKEIVEANGGRIWVDSELHQGARFFFTLPAREPRPV